MKHNKYCYTIICNLFRQVSVVLSFPANEKTEFCNSYKVFRPGEREQLVLKPNTTKLFTLILS